MTKIRTRDLLAPRKAEALPIIRKRLSADEIKGVRYVQKVLGVDEGLAKQILFTDEARAKFLQYKRATLDISLAEILRKLQNSLGKSIRDGKMNDVKSGSFAVGILRDKLFASEKEVKNAIDMTRDVKILVGFRFEPYGLKGGNKKETE